MFSTWRHLFIEHDRAGDDVWFRKRAVTEFLIKEQIPAAEIHQRPAYENLYVDASSVRRGVKQFLDETRAPPTILVAVALEQPRRNKTRRGLMSAVRKTDVLLSMTLREYWEYGTVQFRILFKA